MSIKVSNLTKVYGEQKAVDNISFSVSKGEIVGFLGPNGAGKSTTMKIITGYLQPDGGQVQVCGTDVSTQPIETKKKIGYLPESNPLYYDMYVREYLEFTAEIQRVSGKKEAIQRAIVQVGLTKEASKKIGQLSKGYKQRVGLAAALLHDPEVLILDEPTTGLDPNQIVEIREVIRSLGTNKTVLFSSHILQEVEAICNRVVIINKGTIVADSQLSSLLKQQSDELILELKEKVSPEIFASTGSAEMINASTWKFKTDDADVLRKKLIDITIQNNLNIISLQTRSGSTLESIFRELTQ
ncbi:MAG: gliding motility-associated ABC transporter ATP-binding subunit GldA [Chitinophagaceae bacterium]|nr:gliding motility-associated ABC transporter ATP-binding subunit GldA [Chitinophagaceae bacterium]